MCVCVCGVCVSEPLIRTRDFKARRGHNNVQNCLYDTVLISELFFAEKYPRGLDVDIVLDNTVDTKKPEFEKAKKTITNLLKVIPIRRKGVNVRVIPLVVTGKRKPVIVVKKRKDVKPAIKKIRTIIFKPKFKSGKPKKADVVKKVKDRLRKADPKRPLIVFVITDKKPKPGQTLPRPRKKKPPTAVVLPIGKLLKKPKARKRWFKLLKPYQPKRIRKILKTLPSKRKPRTRDIIRVILPKGKVIFYVHSGVARLFDWAGENMLDHASCERLVYAFETRDTF